MARLGGIPENPLELGLLLSGQAPTPLLDTAVALLLARTLMAATKLNVFEALAAGPLAPAQVAERCATHPAATEKLLFALAAARYLRLTDGRYALQPVARRWMLAGSKRSLRDATLHRYLDLALMEHAEEYLRTGQPTNYHETMSDEQWALYQRGQRSHALLIAPEVARRLPVPPGARAMLDIGGAHGYLSVALCRRHRGLRAAVLDLPAAIVHAAPLLAAEGLGDRVIHRAGDALSDDLGEQHYDLILIANLVHHFDDATNRDLLHRVARALRPGGNVALLDLIRSPSPRQAGQVGALTSLFFAVTSRSGTWSYGEMARWQRAAGLAPRRPISLLTVPGYGMQVATRPPSGA